jgi:hypothetical protein
VDYRKQFLVDISEYQRRMFSYVGDDLEIAVRPNLRDREKPIVLVIHDESCFSSNDGKRQSGWRRIGVLCVLKAKDDAL